ncbi:MAG: hypothetical protein JW832_07485 [Deltaproteobacteria bacterium]|nr:hypothetical protein [Deltaproteobacteria bacterium]
MKKTKHNSAVTREDLFRILAQIDDLLVKQKRNLSVTTIGGVSIILQGFRDRSTTDIDIANVEDAAAFQEICAGKGIPVDIVTISSTVDFLHAPKVVLFSGRALVVNSVTAQDLIKLKLERFYKQDPEDIYAIIQKTSLPYERYKAIVSDMITDFTGNPRGLLLSAMVIVETVYPQNKADFKALLTE